MAADLIFFFHAWKANALSRQTQFVLSLYKKVAITANTKHCFIDLKGKF
jgi:hypothetical protein